MDKIKFLKEAEQNLSNSVSAIDDTDRKIWEFFLNNPPPYKDEMIHGMAESLGLAPDLVEERVYNILGGFINGGASKGKRPQGFSDEALAIGMKIESEHTPNPLIQAKIAFDHAAEYGDRYYDIDSGLPEMEERLKGGTEG